ncbi:NAD(P)-dependent oxidoreductase [Pseudokineococcus sp. 1T1Z-3]|uniref:NAD(P)-dependent oxidoreductase n=1 Tax=Pseudokineococcus sp. 1T1Z-3 TaxID=3132745 RepID=UPI00309625B8
MLTGRSVAVLGLGPMGAPVAANLLRADVDLTVWNRTAARADQLVEAGARRAETVADVDADVVLSLLPDVPQLLEHLTDDVLAAWGRRGTTLVVMSTTSPGRVRDLADRCEPVGVHVVDAPMSGGDKGAREATLSLMVGATEPDMERVRPVLEVLGTTVVHLGGPGAGSVAKLCNQVVVAGTVTLLAEALALAARSGVDPGQVTRVLAGGLAASAVLDQKRDKLVGREYSLGGSVRNQVKDLDYAAAAAADAGLTLPLLEAVSQAFRDVAAEHGDDDHTAVQERYLRG